ncbi:ATP-binding protein [Streptomyces sp. NPDC001889]
MEAGHRVHESAELGGSGPVVLDGELSWKVRVRPSELRSIRHRVASFLKGRGCSAAADDVVLVIGELLANVHEHAEGICDLDVTLHDKRVIVQVSDTVTTPPTPRPRSGAAEAGRGLLLVDALTDHWETTLTATGKVITCTFSTPERGVSP